MIGISERITEHWLWNDAERLKWWIDLLVMSTQDKKVLIGKKVVLLEQGQLIASVASLCERWGRTKTMVKPFLDALIKEGLITKNVTNNVSVITIKNSFLYAHLDTHLDTHLSTHLESQVKPSKSKGNKGNDKVDDAHLDTQNDAHLDTHLESQVKCNENSKVELDTKKFVEFWNAEMEGKGAIVPRIRSVDGKRKKQMLARCREFGKATLVDVVKAVASNDFLNGKNHNGWVASIDWVLSPQNYQKILEGNYANKQHQVQRRRVETTSTCPEDYEGTF